MHHIITLTTDFGRDSSYVAAMKGVILSINAAATIVDISHAIPPQNIAAGAFVLGEAARWFPAGTLHVAVVDPGVGTDRAIVYARVGEQQYVCPDNGLLSYVCREQRPIQAFELTNRSLFLADVSNTFHGRDIMAPVAAHLSLGFSPEQLGPPLQDLHRFPWFPPRQNGNSIGGRVLFCDSFGNLITNIRREDLPPAVDAASMSIEARAHRIRGIVKTYGDVAPGTTIALFGSSGLLELAVAQGNAAAQLRISIGDDICVHW